MRDHETIEALGVQPLLKGLLAEWVIQKLLQAFAAYCVNLSGSEVCLLAR